MPPEDRTGRAEGNRRTTADERRGGAGWSTDVGNLLLLAPSLGDALSDGCRKTMEELGPSQTDLLVVSYNESPDRWLANWQRQNGPIPGKWGFVHVGGMSRSAAATSRDADPISSIQTVKNPSDLTGLGITLSRHLETWCGDGNRTLVCFQSVTALLQYVDVETAYRFLHVLLSRTAQDGIGVYHLDPGAHDEQVVQTLQSLFDAVERVDV